MWSIVYIVPNNPKTSDLTEGDVFQRNFSSINGKLGLNCFSAGSSSVWDTWPRLLAKNVLKQELSGIEVTTFHGVKNFQII